MNAPPRIGLCRGAAVALTSAAAISLTALSVGMVPALADDPTVTTTTSEPATAVTGEYSAEATAPTEATAAPETTSLESTTPDATTSPVSSSATETSDPTIQDTSTTSSAVVTQSTPSVSAAASATSTPSDVAPPAPAAPIVEPERLQAASVADLEAAKASTPGDPLPQTLQQSVIDEATAFVADRNVLQWQPDWVDQDQYHRPLILNPFPGPIQIVYSEGGDPRTLTIQPRTSTVLNLIDAATSLTVMVFDTVGKLTDVAIATAFTGPRPDSVPNVSVIVNDDTSTPIVIDKVTDLGEDPEVGMRKVLLDDVTPAWGVWTENPSGERQFEISKTQQLPGIDAPAEGPPPGYRLVADSESLAATDVLLILVALLIAAVALGATVARVIRRKQRVHREQREQHNRDERPDTRVEARSRPSRTSEVTVRETPAPGEATHAIRLATHSHPGTLTIREVNDDRSRPA